MYIHIHRKLEPSNFEVGVAKEFASMTLYTLYTMLPRCGGNTWCTRGIYQGRVCCTALMRPNQAETLLSAVEYSFHVYTRTCTCTIHANGNSSACHIVYIYMYIYTCTFHGLWWLLCLHGERLSLSARPLGLPRKMRCRHVRGCGSHCWGGRGQGCGLSRRDLADRFLFWCQPILLDLTSPGGL